MHPDIAESKLKGEIKTGKVFLWESSGFDITSKITNIKSNNEIAWKGIAFGVNVIHKWKFEKLKPNKTLVTTSESMNGWLPSLFTGTMTEKLNASLEKWLKLLKKEAEKSGG